MAKEKKSPNEVILERLISKIEADNVLPWQSKHFKDGLPRNYITNRPYSGRNLLLTLCLDYNRQQYMTYKQAESKGYQVRKGEKGIPIIWAAQGGFVDVKVTNEAGEEEEGYKKWVGGGASLYYVFNVSQIDGIPEMPENREGSIEEVTSFIAKIPVKWERGKNPCYIPARDVVEIPLAGDYENDLCYYGTTFHELIHWTAPRVGRECKSFKEDQKKYSYEELVAELGSAFLRGHFRLDSYEVDENNAAYVKGWLEYLESDTAQILKAATDAQKAVDYLLSFTQVGVVKGAADGVALVA